MPYLENGVISPEPAAAAPTNQPHPTIHSIMIFSIALPRDNEFGAENELPSSFQLRTKREIKGEKRVLAWLLPPTAICSAGAAGTRAAFMAQTTSVCLSSNSFFTPCGGKVNK
jgi:hypothetical protein